MNEHQPSVGRQIGALALILVVSFLPSLLGVAFQPGEWYAALAKPAWNPPAWVFGPVWTTLYAAMGVAAWLVWRASGMAGARVALGLFVVQLALNAAWSWLFFGLHRPGLAFAEIVALWLSILATAAAFRRHSRLAAWLLVPYLAWVTFAAALNLAIWRLNA